MHLADGNPTWPPDHTRIAFTSMRDGDQEIYVMNFDGSITVQPVLVVKGQIVQVTVTISFS